MRRWRAWLETKGARTASAERSEEPGRSGSDRATRSSLRSDDSGQSRARRNSSTLRIPYSSRSQRGSGALTGARSASSQREIRSAARACRLAGATSTRTRPCSRSRPFPRPEAHRPGAHRREAARRGREDRRAMARRAAGGSARGPSPSNGSVEWLLRHATMRGSVPARGTLGQRAVHHEPRRRAARGRRGRRRDLERAARVVDVPRRPARARAPDAAASAVGRARRGRVRRVRRPRHRAPARRPTHRTRSRDDPRRAGAGPSRSRTAARDGGDDERARAGIRHHLGVLHSVEEGDRPGPRLRCADGAAPASAVALDQRRGLDRRPLRAGPRSPAGRRWRASGRRGRAPHVCGRAERGATRPRASGSASHRALGNGGTSVSQQPASPSSASSSTYSWSATRTSARPPAAADAQVVEALRRDWRGCASAASTSYRGVRRARGARGSTTAPTRSALGKRQRAASSHLRPHHDVEPGEHAVGDVQHRDRALRVGQLDGAVEPRPPRLPEGARENVGLGVPPPRDGRQRARERAQR